MPKHLPKGCPVGKTNDNFTGTGALCVAARKLPVGSVAMKCLLLYYAICTDYKTGTFYKSYTEIYADTGITERRARRINDGLRQKKIVETVTPTFGSGLSTVYRLNLKVMDELNKSLEPAKEKRVAEMRQKNTERVQAWREKQKLSEL